jgi:uncharacterized membrane protein
LARKGSRIARYSGLAIAGVGVAHFTSPQLFEPLTKSAFSNNIRQHTYVNGGIETLIGLGFANRSTRGLATVGSIGYLAYLASNLIRNTS